MSSYCMDSSRLTEQYRQLQRPLGRRTWTHSRCLTSAVPKRNRRSQSLSLQTYIEISQKCARAKR